jgi:hypothetical protein
MPQRLSSINFFVLMIVVIYTIVAERFVINSPLVETIFAEELKVKDAFVMRAVSSAVVFLTSIGFYQFIVRVALHLLAQSELFLRVYWGRLYLNGLWSYEYTIDSSLDQGLYFGIWRIEQSLFETKVNGFGLTDKFVVRSRVRSMSDMIPAHGMYEFINIRSDAVEPAIDYYSRTSMHFELNRHRFSRYPVRMRGKTVVYGGPYNGRVYNTVFVKHERARTEEDVLEGLRRAAKKRAH